MNRFQQQLDQHEHALIRNSLQTLQINVGRQCNQTCRHCHVDAAPWRVEMMDAPVARRIGEWILRHSPETVDITGGAPELSRHWRYFVETARGVGARVIDRCNLTIIETDAFSWLPDYLAKHEVEVVASLPCYSAENVDAQRGEGVFDQSLTALRKLNAVGYGSELPLNLVYNPVGASLPGPQAELEADYRRALKDSFGIVFTGLFTITNQPIARFAQDLRAQGRWEEYMDLLANSFNPATLDGLMCRNTVSVGWRGEVYDCDFNQMLGMQLRNGKPQFLWDIDPGKLVGAAIQTGEHCLACTAGSGSSCGGALTST
jgi:radical SAM/Cys-rich protein